MDFSQPRSTLIRKPAPLVGFSAIEFFYFARIGRDPILRKSKNEWASQVVELEHKVGCSIFRHISRLFGEFSKP